MLLATDCFADPAAQARPGVRPSVATINAIVNGDRISYVTLADAKGVKHKNVAPTFDVCSSPSRFLNKQVNLVYRDVLVSNCQSAEPCGKTPLQTLITQMTVMDNSRACSREASAGYTIPWLQAEITGCSVAKVNLRVRQQPGIENQSINYLAPGISFRALEGPTWVGNCV